MDEREKPSGQLAKPEGNQELPERCEICGFERIHVYPAEEAEETIAVCLHCGAHYHSSLGWVDPEGL